MSDWRTYDAIAVVYEQRCTARFEEAARRLLAFAEAEAVARILDLGTGTGAVLSALGERRTTMTRVVGCDRSVPMLRSARIRVPGSWLAAADVARLPFPTASFDLVTANCVLSHLRNYGDALAESRRVLAPRGTTAISAWGPASDPYSAAWNDLLGDAIGKDAAREAVEAVVPSEALLAEPDHVREGLLRAGFQHVQVTVVGSGHACSVEDYVVERGMTAGARFGRHALGESGWRQFLERAEGELRRRFGARVHYERPLVLGRGIAP